MPIPYMSCNLFAVFDVSVLTSNDVYKLNIYNGIGRTENIYERVNKTQTITPAYVCIHKYRVFC